nr:MAG TPA_asm: hypothetical protein [Caudoviricetes sp.]
MRRDKYFFHLNLGPRMGKLVKTALKEIRKYEVF